MEITATSQGGRIGRSLTPLGRLTLAALVLTALVLLPPTLESGEGFFVVQVGGLLVLAALVGAGFRWAPALAGVAMTAILVSTVVFAGYLLTTPGDPTSFALIATMLAALAVGTFSGVGATVQNYRRPAADRRAPGWLRTALASVAALVAGAILTVAVQQPGTAAGIAPEALAALPTVTVSEFKYDQPELHARVGETVALRLDNADSTTHYFEIDDLNVHATMPPGKSSLAVFRPTKAGTYLVYCTPHADKTAHTGMVGKLIVAE